MVAGHGWCSVGRDGSGRRSGYAAERGGQLAPKNLDRHLAVMLQILGEVYRGHAATPNLVVDCVAVGQRSLELFQQVGLGQAPCGPRG